MCSQPPIDKDNFDHFFDHNLHIIRTAPENLTDIGITGGEPTLLGEKLITLLHKIREKLPQTMVHVLTNGRFFANRSYTTSFSKIGTEKILLGIPLHSDYEKDHDQITQVVGSYNETLKGLYNLAEYDFDIELRIVINKINYLRLPELSQYMYRNLPFVKYISLMGLEYTGFSIKNHDKIWIDPIEYQNELEKAVLNLALSGMNVSIFNLPHCLLKESLHEFARQSISDWKVVFLEKCTPCNMKNQCCGLFSTSKRQSSHIEPIL